MKGSDLKNCEEFGRGFRVPFLWTFGFSGFQTPKPEKVLVLKRPNPNALSACVHAALEAKSLQQILGQQKQTTTFRHLLGPKKCPRNHQTNVEKCKKQICFKLESNNNHHHNDNSIILLLVFQSQNWVKIQVLTSLFLHLRIVSGSLQRRSRGGDPGGQWKIGVLAARRGLDLERLAVGSTNRQLFNKLV